MRITDVPFAVLRFQYQLARYPLQVIEDRVVARMDSEQPARLFYERSLGTLDVTVGNALGAPNLEERGAALIERSDALRRAAELDAAATATQEQADQELQAKRDAAVERTADAAAEKQREIDDARSVAQRRKDAAAENAQKRTAAAKQKADELADKRVSSAESAKREKEAKIRRAEEKATASAESKLDDAQAKRSEASGKRTQANRVENLADAEKAKRQSD